MKTTEHGKGDEEFWEVQPIYMYDQGWAHCEGDKGRKNSKSHVKPGRRILLAEGVSSPEVERA